MKPSAKRPKVLRPAQLVTSHSATAGAATAAAAGLAAADGPGPGRTTALPLASQAPEAEGSDLLWDHRSFFALDQYQELQQRLPDVIWDIAAARTSGSSKRALEPVPSGQGYGDGDDDNNDDRYAHYEAVTPDQAWLVQALPELYPSVPSKRGQAFNVDLSNPFALNGTTRHPRLKTRTLIPDGAVNGYIKFRVRTTGVEDFRSPVLGRGKGLDFFTKPLLSSRSQQPPQQLQPIAGASPSDFFYLPPDFGRRLKLDDIDNKLLRFYLVAYCEGRTLLSKTNFWLSSIASMAVEEECVKHALLALAGTYLLDYLQSPVLLARTNEHYQRAVTLITEALSNTELRTSNRGDSIVSALSLLIVDDCVNWELRRPNKSLPNWYRGGQLAKLLLDESDPGYRYWKPVNVQCSEARLALANWGAFSCIVAQPVTVLDIHGKDNTFDWLLAGTQRDVQKIHGGTGMCPKLLHTFAQVTHLTIRIATNPESVAIPHGANKIQERLDSMHQWSELSPGHQSKEALLESCQYQLDSNGKVTSPAMVTDLTGEIWIATVQMYLNCRFYRRPRSHALVQQNLRTFLECLTLMPYNGPLFTSQAPFCCIFLMSLISYREEDRRMIKDWFEAIVSNIGCRSSVPPVWETVQRMWTWMDTALSDEHFDESSSIGDREPWWEVMVEHLIEAEGYISLI